jgi:hypothetical protein
MVEYLPVLGRNLRALHSISLRPYISKKGDFYWRILISNGFGMLEYWRVRLRHAGA